MKNTILKIAFAAALALVAGVTAYNAQNKEELSDLALENIEALAGDESGTGGNYEYSDGFPQSFICGIKVSAFQKCGATVIVCQGGGKGCNSRRCPQHG